MEFNYRWKKPPRLSLAQSQVLVLVAKGTPAIMAKEPNQKTLNILLRKGYVKLFGADNEKLGITLKGSQKLEKAKTILAKWDELQTLMME